MPVLAGLGCLLCGACERPAQVTSSVIPSADEQITLGESLYNQGCANCHYDGSGNPAAADLKGSPIVAQGPKAIMRVILHGQSGVAMVDGKKLGGHMPKMPFYTDEEAAALAAYVRSAFANERSAVNPAEAAEIRRQ